MHLFIASINLFLRFSWAANRIPMLAQMPPAQLILLVEMAEIFRRSMWFIFRIEWEMVNTELKKLQHPQDHPSKGIEESEMLLLEKK